MPRNYQEKSREIKRSLVRRARLRKAYFKMVGDESKPVPAAGDISDEATEPTKIDEYVDSEEEPEPKKSEPRKIARPKPIDRVAKKELAQQKRQEKYREFKSREAAKDKAVRDRQHKTKTITGKTSRGQPKLGARVGLMLDKIRESQ